MLRQITINSRKIYSIGLGSEFHYQLLEKNIQIYKKEKSFWVYDKAKLDLAYFLANHPHKLNQVTYVTGYNFLTLEIKEKPLDKQISTNDKVLNAIHNNEYKILSGNYEYHPFKELEKICGYMNVKYTQQMKNFFKLTFSTHPISIKGSFQPKMKQILSNYLNNEGLKVKNLERKRTATSEEAQQNFRIWKQRYEIEEISKKALYQYCQNQGEKKLKWMEENKFGWEIQGSVIIEGFGKRFSSFAF